MRTVTPIPAALAAMLALVCLLGHQGYRTRQRVRLAERHAAKAELLAVLAHGRLDVRGGLPADPGARARRHLRAVGGAA